MTKKSEKNCASISYDAPARAMDFVHTHSLSNASSSCIRALSKPMRPTSPDEVTRVLEV